MDERSYLEQSGGFVRLKVVHVRQAEPDLVFSHDELKPFPQLKQALEESRLKASVQTYPNPFEMLNPTPVTAVMKAEDVLKLSQIIMRKSGKDLYATAVKIEAGGEKYLIAVEHHCG
ncbi:MAG: hypothetical protein QW470_03330 [Candidatus Caldarchaeum sp.]|uniref:Uncharacterized protein n=1 Tax=Caldiarchaeum subterraneum TaxID=311458 RepID=A0A7C5Q863_CALS0